MCVFSRDVKFDFFFLKFKLRLLKLELNSNFIYIVDPQRQQISCTLFPATRM